MRRTRAGPPSARVHPGKNHSQNTTERRIHDDHFTQAWDVPAGFADAWRGGPGRPDAVAPRLGGRQHHRRRSGRPYTEGYRKAFYDPFTEATGIGVVSVARDAEPTAQFKSVVETGSYIWDVCTITLSARLILERDGLLDPIEVDPDLTKDLMPGAVHPNFLGVDVYSTIFAFNPDTVTPAPASWADFWDTDRILGRRALRKNPIDTLEQALMADGVALADLYPLDLDRAFAKLDKIKDQVAVWWTGGAQTSQMMQSGEVDMLAGWNARMQAAIESGAPAQIVWNQGLYSIEGWGLPKGGPKADAARKFVAFCTGAEQQAKFTQDLAYGPTNLKAYDHIAAERAAELPTAPQNLKVMRMADEVWWEANRASVSERFNSWLLF
ncbi:MAG: ABC transporter substrate-binding protein [Paracoccus sp. (in: a-proteobacteria)]|uniref:ABC transporter substrate-binding protein n=1 Tax=Paracoccus sp. TaxID=267 RepID=UPI0039E3C2B9